MTTTYCSTEDVTQYYTGKFRKISSNNTYVVLQAESGVSQTGHEEKVYLTAANAGLFYPGDSVRVFDDGDPVGELGVITSITFNGNSSCLVLSADMTGTYTTANAASVQLRSWFNKDSDPDVASVQRMINDAEDWIDAQTNDAWRSTTVTEEYHRRDWRRSSFNPGLAVNLRHTHVTTFVSGTDKVEIWNGSSWEEWVSTKTEGRGGDYWVNYTEGTLFLRSYWFLHQTDAVRMTYRYGNSTVPKDIRKACAMIVAKQLLEQEQHLNNMPSETGQGYTYGSDPRVSQYQKEINTIISRHRREIFFLK